MTIEKTLEIQRHRLLSIVAGLLFAVGVLVMGPVSGRFSEWSLSAIGAVLSRIEAASRYLVLAQACLMADRFGLDEERRQIAVSFAPQWGVDEADVSLAACRRRLRVLRIILMDLPRHALRLLRRIAKQMRRAARDVSCRFNMCLSAGLHGHCSLVDRIERPPDKRRFASAFVLPLPGCRAGGVGVCAALG